MTVEIIDQLREAHALEDQEFDSIYAEIDSIANQIYEYRGSAEATKSALTLEHLILTLRSKLMVASNKLYEIDLQQVGPASRIHIKSREQALVKRNGRLTELSGDLGTLNRTLYAMRDSAVFR